MQSKVFVYDTAGDPWVNAGAAGMYRKVAHADAASGRFLGLLALDPLTRSTAHQHLDVAASFFLEGALTDHAGTARCGDMGINLAGATHDAIAFSRTVVAARLDGPVIYLEEEGVLHPGARRSRRPELNALAEPDINIAVDALPPIATDAPGVKRQTIFDYAGTKYERRISQLRIQPEMAIAAHVIPEPCEWFVRGGDIAINGAHAHAGCFIIVEPGCIETIESKYGCLALVWADGPAVWDRDGAAASLYGHGAAPGS